MSFGLIALLDDVAAIAKAAAASLDDIVGQAAKAGSKAVGVVIDDAAVTPRYAIGFAAERELPIVGKIALGSLRNKLVILLPLALLLSYFAPSAITPLLMMGGLYLCYEGAEKALEPFIAHGFMAHGHDHGSGAASTASDQPAKSGQKNEKSEENAKVADAIRTDLILSSEIMAITLGGIRDSGFWQKAVILAGVGVFITLAVYGVVALIVKADDMGLALARFNAKNLFGAVTRLIGRAIVKSMPHFLTVLGFVGTSAMIWVGGSIIIHGMTFFGWGALGHAIERMAAAASNGLPLLSGFASWAIDAAASGLFGFILGALCVLIVSFLPTPLVLTRPKRQ